MKITVQEKIAELERRVTELEEEKKKRTEPQFKMSDHKTMSHWNEMWRHFRAIFGERE